MCDVDPLYHCIYVSSATDLFDEPDLAKLLVEMRTRNAELGITGMLLYSDGTFLQVLEGPQSVVSNLLRRVALDPRHKGLIKLVEGPIEGRAFADWSMGFVKSSHSELLQLPGSNDFFLSGNCLLDVGAGLATDMLQSFRDTNRRWVA